ncbi:MAG: C10 family peptidase [Sedimentisphaerales bacterium]
MEKILRLCFALRVYLLSLFCFFVLQGSWCAIVWAKAVPSDLAREVVNEWLAKEAKPMGSRLGSEVENVKTFTDSNGQPVYYVVVLKPNGFVVVSADDLVEPIVCFSSGGSYDSSKRNPLGALVSRDIPARVNVSRSVHAKLLAGSSTGGLTKQQAMVHKSGEKAFGKWTELLGKGSGPSVSAVSESSISDIRVAPLLQTEWGQDVVCSNKACYNYYTPPGSEGDASNYYAGCVATAMAQYMQFWQYPVSGVGTPSFTITVDGSDQTAYLRGGDGSGGAYNWSQMPLVPGCSTTVAQRKAIGALTYDAGVAVNMDYESDSSGASMSDAAAAMVSTFGYSNAIIGGDEYSNVGDGLNGMINPNLDSGNPVMLGISGDGGHAIVADGYGYQSSTLYHHLNMGWDGEKDVWYNLPNVDTSWYSFTIVDSAIYNIYVSGTGEIISGRVMAADTSTPISGATVIAVKTGSGEIYRTTTNTSGIYALVNVPSNSTYTISVAMPGHSFPDQVTSTGQSQNGVKTSGNCWAVDFVSSGDVVMPVVAVGKCTITAGSNNNDAISLSGTLNATMGEVLAADEIVVDINSANRVNHFVQPFPMDPTTFKNGKFNYSNKPLKTSFALDTKTLKFSFTAKNVDLSGLSCPLAVRIEIGDYNAETNVDETIVNGPKKPIPISFLMGIKNSLRVDKSKFTRDKNTGNITQVAVSGGFSDENVDDVALLTNPLNITVGSQTFTIPAGSFKSTTKGRFTCSKVDTSNGIAAVTFDFNKCTFTLTIKNTNFAVAASTVPFNMEFGDFNEGVLLP